MGNPETRLADFFKVLSCDTRINILCALFPGEVSVGELAEQLALPSSNISHQLQILRSSKLVRRRRAGKMILYSLADDSVRTMLDSSMKYAGVQMPIGGDNNHAQ